MARRNDHTREELKKIILETSWKIIGEKGFEHLTARNIAKDIGYSPGTIYNIFESLDDLYLQINASTLDILYNELSSPECSDSTLPPIINMKRMAEKYLEFAKKYRPYWLMLFDLKVTENRTNEQWYEEKVEKLFEPLEKLMAPYFPPEKKEEKKVAVRILWASVHGLCFLQETDKLAIISNKNQTPDITGYLIDTFISGIISK